MKTFRLYHIALFLIVMPCITYAQTDSLAYKLPNEVAETYFFRESFWLNSINSSEFYKSGIRNYSKIELNYGYEDGDYKKVYDPAKNSIINFNTTGIKSHKKLHFLGTFDYNHQISKDIDWSLMMDADRANPFIVADSIGGDWIKDRYTLGLKFGTEPLWNFVHFGLTLNYSVALGGRDNDPRPKSTTKNIYAAPSITFLLGSNNSIGATYIYGDYMQDIDVMIKSGVGSAMFYKQLGFALKENPIVKSSYDYRIEAFKSGASLLYQTSLKDIDIIAEGTYILSTEKDIYAPYASVTDTAGIVSLNSTTDARFSEKQYSLTLGLDFKTLRIPQKISLGINYNDGNLFNNLKKDAQDTIINYGQVEFSRKITTASFKYIALLNASNIHKATCITLGANYSDEEGEQIFYAKRDIESLTAFAKINQAFRVFGQEFSGEVGFRGKFNLSSDFVINPKSIFIEPETAVTKPMVWSAYYFDSAEWISPSAAITYYPSFGKKFKSYFSVNWTGVVLTNNDYYQDGTRTFAQAKFGLLF